ncbi:MAG: hypothetical protein AB7Q00_08755 [Phycisphaerales bacterium]
MTVSSLEHSNCSRQRCRVIVIALGMITSSLMLSACASHRPGPYQSQVEASRDPVRAERLSREAADLMATNPAKAEDLLRESLTADLYCGPAHNNLGVIHLSRGELYEAASEFEWARKLMPGHPDPRLNLALALHRAGKSVDAIAAARAALEVRPEYVPAKQALALLLVNAGTRTVETDQLLDDVSLAGETDRWRSWARMELVRHEHDEAGVSK